jgi:hypothetical protein
LIEKILRKRKTIYPLLLLLIGISFYNNSDYKDIGPIKNPVFFKDPIQNEVKNPQIIKISKDNYRYELEPLYDYEIN